MILVFSTKNDFSTINVCDWLKYYNANYTKLYSEYFRNESETSIELDSIETLHSNSKFSNKEVNAIWCR